jgi:pyruvate dehydrogenase E1 component beta subunit
MAVKNYGEAIREAFEYLLGKYPHVFTIGQGLWSPWYVGNSMTELEVKFGKERVIDTPVSEQATTGAAVGASLCGYRPIVIHPRVDFALLAVDQMVNQAAKWCHMLGGQTSVPVTFRCIINRGGEQGAQHSQSLHSWFAHIPGLRVVTPYSPQDARDLLIASVLCDDPVMYIDDRWLYDLEADLPPIEEYDLASQTAKIIEQGRDVTLVGNGYTTNICLEVAKTLKLSNITCDVIDLRILNPLKIDVILESIQKTQKLCVIDGDWKNCGIAGEIIASVVESSANNTLTSPPLRITLPDAPAPTSKTLENIYYFNIEQIGDRIKTLLNK